MRSLMTILKFIPSRQLSRFIFVCIDQFFMALFGTEKAHLVLLGALRYWDHVTIFVAQGTSVFF